MPNVSKYHVLNLILKKKPKRLEEKQSFISEVYVPQKPIRLKRRSLLTGKISSMILPITMADVNAYLSGTTLLQDAFPQLTPVQREFIKTGITPEEWAKHFGKPGKE